MPSTGIPSEFLFFLYQFHPDYLNQPHVKREYEIQLNPISTMEMLRHEAQKNGSMLHPTQQNHHVSTRKDLHQ